MLVAVTLSLPRCGKMNWGVLGNSTKIDIFNGSLVKLLGNIFFLHNRCFPQPSWDWGSYFHAITALLICQILFRAVRKNPVAFLPVLPPTPFQYFQCFQYLFAGQLGQIRQDQQIQEGPQNPKMALLRWDPLPFRIVPISKISSVRSFYTWWKFKNLFELMKMLMWRFCLFLGFKKYPLSSILLKILKSRIGENDGESWKS